jgi:hypothetical protein
VAKKMLLWPPAPLQNPGVLATDYHTAQVPPMPRKLDEDGIAARFAHEAKVLADGKKDKAVRERACGKLARMRGKLVGAIEVLKMLMLIDPDPSAELEYTVGAVVVTTAERCWKNHNDPNEEYFQNINTIGTKLEDLLEDIDHAIKALHDRRSSPYKGRPPDFALVILIDRAANLWFRRNGEAPSPSKSGLGRFGRFVATIIDRIPHELRPRISEANLASRIYYVLGPRYERKGVTPRHRGKKRQKAP